MKTVAITGASGNIGKALQRELHDRYRLRPIDHALDGIDLRQPDALAGRLDGCDALIHLAWRYIHPDSRAGHESLDNIEMHRHAVTAAQAAGVPRLLMASSVHADYFYDWAGPQLIDVDRAPRANGLYGGLKLLVEAIDQDHASDRLRITDLRYGGVRSDGKPHPRSSWERRVWLSHRDLASLITAIIEHPDPPNYSRLYAVSDNVGRVHDLTNDFGWTPQDSASPLPDEATHDAQTP